MLRRVLTRRGVGGTTGGGGGGVEGRNLVEERRGRRGRRCRKNALRARAMVAASDGWPENPFSELPWTGQKLHLAIICLGDGSIVSAKQEFFAGGGDGGGKRRERRKRTSTFFFSLPSALLVEVPSRRRWRVSGSRRAAPLVNGDGEPLGRSPLAANPSGPFSVEGGARLREGHFSGRPWPSCRPCPAPALDGTSPPPRSAPSRLTALQDLRSTPYRS